MNGWIVLEKDWKENDLLEILASSKTVQYYEFWLEHFQFDLSHTIPSI